MGRVVGDGAFFFYVQDVAVHPQHRRRGLGLGLGLGLGKAIMQRLRDQVTALAGGRPSSGSS